MTDASLPQLKVVCTGRGQAPHDGARTLGAIAWSDTGVLIAWSEGSKSRRCIEYRSRPVTVHGRPATSLDQGRIVFRCPVCGRDVPRKAEALTALFASGVPRIDVLDISMMHS